MEQGERNEGGSNLGAVLLLLLLGLGGIVLVWLVQPVGPKADAVVPPTSMGTDAIRASLNRLDSETPIIGVVVNKVAKAYPVRNLMRPDQHVLNDVVGGIPITVTWCDVDRCAKVLTGPGTTPLKVRVIGSDPSRPGKMLLGLEQTHFWQDTLKVLRDESKTISLETFPCVETSWGEWKTTHPETLVQETPFGS